MVQSLGGDTLPDAYDLVVRGENSLIDVRKLPPRLPVPMFVEISSKIQEEVAPNTYATPLSLMFVYPNTKVSTSGSSSLVAEMNNIKNLLRIVSNEFVSIKCQQVTPPNPPQNYQGGRLPFQHNSY